MDMHSFIDTFEKLCEQFHFTQEQIDVFYQKYQIILINIVENKGTNYLLLNFLNEILYKALHNDSLDKGELPSNLLDFKIDNHEVQIQSQSYQFFLSNIKAYIDKNIRNTRYIEVQSDLILKELKENHANGIAKYGSFKYKSLAARNVESACKQENQLIHDLNIVIDNINISLKK